MYSITLDGKREILPGWNIPEMPFWKKYKIHDNNYNKFQFNYLIPSSVKLRRPASKKKSLLILLTTKTEAYDLKMENLLLGEEEGESQKSILILYYY